MGRAKANTLLPVDRWAQLIGVNPLHFNGVYFQSEGTQGVCGDLIAQHSYQLANRLSREDIANAIGQAEAAIATAIGSPVAPDWIAGDIRRFIRPRYARYNVNGYSRAVELRYGRFLTGGQRAATLIADDAAVTYDDNDGDGYDETATCTFSTTVTDANELRLFFPGHDADPAWEIRPLLKVAIASGTATITLRRELLVDPDLWERLDADRIDGSSEGNSNFLAEVEAWRVWNDPSVQAQMQWEGAPDCGCLDGTCGSCRIGIAYGCLSPRDYRLGLVGVVPATWDEDTEQFNATTPTYYRGADRAKTWYRAGYRDERQSRPDVQMAFELEWMVTILACGYLDRPLCSCQNARAQIERWRTDLAMDQSTPNATKRWQLGNAVNAGFGTTAGAVEVWRRLNQPGSDWILGRAAGE